MPFTRRPSRRQAVACTLLALFIVAADTWAMSSSGGSECPGYTAIDSLPFHIDKPGLYRVTSNLSGPKGITVGSDDVTLDLNGFLLEGEGAANGVFVEEPFSQGSGSKKTQAGTRPEGGEEEGEK